MLKRNVVPYAWLFSEIDIDPDAHVLEIGFGPGYGISTVLRRIAQGRGTITGLDFSETMLKKVAAVAARDPARDKVRLELGDAARMPFTDDSFDIVFAVNVIYFWKDLARCFKEARRVLRPGGIAVFYFTDAACLRALPLAADRIFEFYTPAELQAAAIAAGFHPLQHLQKEVASKPVRIGHLLTAVKPE